MDKKPQVLVAGFNVDRDAIEELTRRAGGDMALTPETISAAYARISRDPRPVNVLRREAREEIPRARKSNQTIVFDMGHSSIAEHAVFNLDIIGVSRLVAEEIEKFRLVSYTEKSQRYVLLNGDFVVPPEIVEAGFAAEFREVVARQNGLYHELYPRLRDLIFRKYPQEAAQPKKIALLEGWAKEDARYILALATETQLGLTINTRNLELMLRRLAASPRGEARQLALQLYGETHPLAPSLIRYAKPTAYDLLTRNELAELCRQQGLSSSGEAESNPPQEVSLLATTPRGDEQVLAALIHATSGRSFADCLLSVEKMDRQARSNFFQTACRHMQAYDPVLREFEYADFLFELVVSASCFAQLKRHRMASMTVQDYDPKLGITLPPAVLEAGMGEPFREVVGLAEDLYQRLTEKAPAAAAYILTNAHRRRMLMKVNARELYHLSRIRADRHAQWDIRQTVEKMLEQAREALPLTMFLAAGKDEFEQLYRKVYL